MNPCEPFAAAVLDPKAPRPEGFAAHLSTCAACRALRVGHQSAQLLQGVALPPAPKTPVGPVLRRGAVLLAVLGLATFALLRPSPAAPPEVAVVPVDESPLEVKPLQVVNEGSLEELALLTRTATLYARVDPVAHGYGPRFGALPHLFDPSSSVVFTQEESP